MVDSIEGIHHITSMAKDAGETDRFFRDALGLRRVKKTVNFDAPEVYHLYYANGKGQPGTVMTYFPFPNIVRGTRGNGEVGTTVFSVPAGSLAFWESRFAEKGVGGIHRAEIFGEQHLSFDGVDGDGFALAEVAEDEREPWTGSDIPLDRAIRGFHSATILLADAGGMRELLKFMGFQASQEENGRERMVRSDGNGAQTIDLVTDVSAPAARQGAGSVHHIAFAVADTATQRDVRERLIREKFSVTPVIDRNYFFSVYFRAPGGVLLEIATNEPGFAADEDWEHLGEELKLPSQHAHLRPHLETHLPPLD